MKSLKKIMGYKIRAFDGPVGKVNDVYFDDRLWKVRYIVDKTGSWLWGRQILLSPDSVFKINYGSHTISMDLTVSQVENSPGVSMDLPVYLIQEIKLARYYEWPNYWAPIGVRSPETTLTDTEGIVERSFADTFGQGGENTPSNHLQSLSKVLHYKLYKDDEIIGTVSDVYYDGNEWDIKDFQIELHKTSMYDKLILINPREIRAIDSEQESIELSISYEELGKKDDLRGVNMDTFSGA